MYAATISALICALSLAESLFGWIAAQIPVQPHKCSTFGLRGVAVRMHWSTAADQPKSYESCLTVVTLIEGCPRKRNSAKQALNGASTTTLFLLGRCISLIAPHLEDG